MEKVLDKLKAARTTLHAAQTKHREDHDKCLRDALEEKETEIKDADDPKKAKKAAAAIESLIRKHSTEESYTRIKQVVHPKFRWRSSTSGHPQERR
jgi:gamma-glutamyl:cysteine ligase YbdK (ATP-grasp superfamily)